MMKHSLVFFGSGPVAAESLRLLAKNFDIEAVVTKPKPNGHRGEFPTLTMAKSLGLTIYTPTNKNELSELIATRPFKSDIGVVIDYGIIIAQDVIDYFSYGIVNSHFSLLPQWRGADPITFSILSGQKETGVSLMLITAGLDEGPLLSQIKVEIEKDATTESLTEKLIEASDHSLQTVLPLWVNDKTSAQPQESVTIATSTKPTYSRKLTKEDGRIEWTKPAEQIEREIRAYSTWPKSYTNFSGLDVAITQASVLETNSQNWKIGQPHINEDKKLVVACGDKILCIQKLKPAGKPEMDASSFINGYSQKLGLQA